MKKFLKKIIQKIIFPETRFTLLARDYSAPGMVRQWAYERERAIKTGFKPQSDLEKVANARKIADEMEVWKELYHPNPKTEIRRPQG